MRARLLKVMVQPIYVAEQGHDLIEIPVQAFVMTAAQWRDLDPREWAEEGANAVEAQLARPSTL